MSRCRHKDESEDFRGMETILRRRTESRNYSASLTVRRSIPR